MYNAFFGFKEKPFKLVPNPDYLYLSKSHEIALAHLTYATDQGDGFVVITGEVGTGKTTLCRIFLERLDETAESAYIFNPQLDAVQLLNSICNEFGIKTNFKTVKELLDVINGYLIKKNQAGQKVLLVIDEAQNLNMENLEMVRMLSNLETTRNKLLQIILVGQPELSDTLDSYEMRQLAQRISLNCHLIPLSSRETEGYIHHRTNIAAQRDLPVFSRGACRRIHRYANGIPRLINIASDRALLTAFSLNRHKVSTAIAQTAIKELSARGKEQKDGTVLHKLLAWGGALIVMVLIIAVVLYGRQIRELVAGQQSDNTAAAGVSSHVEGNTTQKGQVYKIPQSIPEDQQTRTPVDPAAPQDNTVSQAYSRTDSQKPFSEVLGELDTEGSRFKAAAALLRLWRQPIPAKGQVPEMIEDQRYFEILARQYGLRLHAFEADWSLVKRINMPVVIALKKEGLDKPVYMTVVSVRDDRVTITDGKENHYLETDLTSLQALMEGEIYLFWKNIIGFDFIIAKGANSEAVVAVKTLLVKIGYRLSVQDPTFDPDTIQAVKDFQGRCNLDPDGLVGAFDQDSIDTQSPGL